MRERAAALGVSDEAYIARASGDPLELDRLIELLRVGETRFFRHRAQLAALGERVLPSLRGPVSAWSAGCASGEEAWTLAMMLAERGLGVLAVGHRSVGDRAGARAAGALSGGARRRRGAGGAARTLLPPHRRRRAHQRSPAPAGALRRAQPVGRDRRARVRPHPVPQRAHLLRRGATRRSGGAAGARAQAGRLAAGRLLGDAARSRRS